jgi:hypothetical protein
VAFADDVCVWVGLLESNSDAMMAARLDAAGELPNQNVWTSTSDDGTSNNNDCAQWTSTAALATGGKGSTHRLDRWTSDAAAYCTNSLAFYCVSKTVVSFDGGC